MGKVRSKRYTACLEKVPPGPVPVLDAIGVLKSFEGNKFDPSVELVMLLGIDPKQADQIVRGAISLPNGIGASRKVIAFCDGDDVAKATEAGAMEAGGEELVQKVQDGWMDFDVAVSTPAMMKTVSRLGRMLGPQGKMPSPKAGTVVKDVATAVSEYAAGKVEFRNDDGGNVHALVGKLSFEPDTLAENIQAFVDQIKRMRPTAAKGAYMKKAFLSTTMSPAVPVELG